MANENDNAPRGLEPAVGPMGSIKRQEYRVYSSNSAAIYIGDPVAQRSDGTIDLATAGAGNRVLGALVGFKAPDASAFDYPYIPATCGSGYTGIVADDPNQLFIVQEDSDGGDLALADEGSGIDLVSGTGNTSTGLSGWVLDSSSAAVGDSTLQMKIIRKYDGAYGGVVGDYCRWVCKINYHQNGIAAGQLI